ncbi:hypothetical protein HerbRD11066_57070 [Herbidospora sp. RD11066]
MSLPPSSQPVLISGIVAGLALGLAMAGFAGGDITQIMSQVTALVALYVVKQPPSPSA